MTLRETASQLHSLSVDGFFNRQKVTVRWLEDYISTMLIRSGSKSNSLVMEIALPDGWWHFTIHKFKDGGKIGFDSVRSAKPAGVINPRAAQTVARSIRKVVPA